MEVLGIKKGSFVDKSTGSTITYCHLHVADQDKNVDGLAVEVLKIPQGMLDKGNQVNVGDEISVTYNKFGRIETIEKL